MIITKTLKEICKVDWGNTSLTKKSYVKNGQFLGVSAAGIDGKMNHFEHEAGVTVISAIGANCGRIFFPEDNFTAIKNTITLTPNVEIIYPKYLFFSLQNNKFLKRGAGQPFITKGDVEKYQISFPNLPEQKHIVETLEKADALRKKRKEADELSNRIIQSVFVEMFGDPIQNPKNWEIVRLGDISAKITDGEHQNPRLTYKGYHLIMAADVKEERVDFSQNKFVSDTDFNKFTKKCKPEKNDLLLVSRGATIGRCTTIKYDKPFCLMGSVILVKTGDKLNSKYLECLFKHVNFAKKIFNVSSASAQQAIYLAHLKKLKLPLPDLKLQQKFADLVQKVEKIKEKQQESKQDLDNLFNVLMQKTFKTNSF